MRELQCALLWHAWRQSPINVIWYVHVVCWPLTWSKTRRMRGRSLLLPRSSAVEHHASLHLVDIRFRHLLKARVSDSGRGVYNDCFVLAPNINFVTYILWRKLSTRRRMPACSAHCTRKLLLYRLLCIHPSNSKATTSACRSPRRFTML